MGNVFDANYGVPLPSLSASGSDVTISGFGSGGLMAA